MQSSGGQESNCSINEAYLFLDNSECPEEHYKRTVAIPLLDILISQMEKRFKGEGRHACALLSLVPSVMIAYGIEPFENFQGILHWERDLPCLKSLESEFRMWQAVATKK